MYDWMRNEMLEQEPKLVVIKTFSTRMEAELARMALEARGIQAVIRADDCGGMHSAMAFSIGHPRLMVFDVDAEVAMKLLEQDQAWDSDYIEDIDEDEDDNE
jgi:hypothetical protein